jgi:hypothetical protein
MEILAIASTRSGNYLKPTSSSLMEFFSSGPKMLTKMGEWWHEAHTDLELPNFHSNTHFRAQEDVEEIYDETFWARQRELLKEKDKFVSIDEL